MSGSVRLRDVAARLDAAGLLLSSPDSADALDVPLQGVSDDSRQVAPGDLFCAWAGTASDAHEHVPAALRSGAVAVLAERVPADPAVPHLVVRDGRHAAALAALLLHGDPHTELTLVGVTGTNGKTTTVWLLRHLLAVRTPCASIGTLGAIGPDGTVIPGSEALTTPGPVQLARTLRQLVAAGARALAMEVSSHALEQRRVAGLHFDVAVFTNLSRDHLDYHGTLERYLAAKRSLVAALRLDGTAVVNADDPAWAGLADEAPFALTFGGSPAADLRFADITMTATGTAFTLATREGSVPVRIPLLGEFNVQNAVGAAAACVALGYPLAELVAALGTLPQVPGRLERIATAPCPVLRDYAHTPDALERSLAALRPLTRGRLIVVFGAGGDRDRGKRPLMGRAAERGADLPIVTSDNPRTEDPDLIIDEILAGMDARRALRVTDRRHAIAHALELAKPEDIVLLAGKGHEDYQVVGTEKQPFDEREVVRELWSASPSEVGS